MIRVQEEDFDTGAEMEKLVRGKSDIGAIVSFVGVVRDSPDRPLVAMTLEHYPGMTERELQRIEAEAQSRWPLSASLIIHRYGRLSVGEQIVLVITASAHRQAAFDAANFLMDWLKTQAPFWKLEETDDGARWVEADRSDDAAARRWSK